MRVGWSKTRREVYGELEGKIWIWGWDGKLKKRVRYSPSGDGNEVFSPDGKLLITRQVWGSDDFISIDVQSGKLVQTYQSSSLVGDYPMVFSPDGLYVGGSMASLGTLGGTGIVGFGVLRVSDGKLMWHYEGQCNAKWVSSQRIGVATIKDFEWRDPAGKVIRRLPGPCGNVWEWALSPDGNWIYSCESNGMKPDGIIRKWRAR